MSRLSLHVPTNDFVIGNDGSGDLAPWAIKGATPRGDDVILWFDWLRVPYERRRQGNWQVSDFLKFKVLAVTRRTTDGLHATGSPHAMLLDMDDPVLDDERKRIPIPKVVRAARDCKWAAPAGVVSVREDCVRLVAPENGCVVTTDIPSQFLGRRLAVTYDIKESQGFATLDIGTTNNIISRKFGPLYGKATNITVTLPTMVPSDADTLVLIRMAFGWLEIRSLGFE